MVGWAGRGSQILLLVLTALVGLLGTVGSWGGGSGYETVRGFEKRLHLIWELPRGQEMPAHVGPAGPGVAATADFAPQANSTVAPAVNAVRGAVALSVRGSSTSSSGIQAHAKEIQEVAEAQYWYQRSEKNHQIHPAFVRYGANWPCIWGEELTGVGTGDGSKWTCGIRRLGKHCTVYSFGSRGNTQFEKGISALRLGCEIHIYDPTSAAPTGAAALGFSFHSIGLGTRDGKEKLTNGAGTLPVSTLKSLMRTNGHSHIDFLKVDIDYMEHTVMEHLATSGWPSVGELLLEVHLEGGKGYNGKSLDKLFRIVEKANFRLFHHEINWEYGASCCIEYSFIQMEWQPDSRHYSMAMSPTYNDKMLKTYPQHKDLIQKYLMGKERGP